MLSLQSSGCHSTPTNIDKIEISYLALQDSKTNFLKWQSPQESWKDINYNRGLGTGKFFPMWCFQLLFSHKSALRRKTPPQSLHSTCSNLWYTKAFGIAEPTIMRN